MITIRLETHQAEMLRDIVAHTLRDLHGEIRRTDNWLYKAGLKERAEQLRQLLVTLDDALPMEEAA